MRRHRPFAVAPFLTLRILHMIWREFLANVAGPVLATFFFLSAAAADDTAVVVTYNAVSLPDPAQDKTLFVRVSMPDKGAKLPVILFSHGGQYSKDDYLPLTEFWAARGFVVIQPTHLESRALGIPKDDPRLINVWLTRAQDMIHILDAFDVLERKIPMLKGRMDRAAVIVAGHSFGGQTASLLIGAEVNDSPISKLKDSRIKAALLMAPPGFSKGFLNMSWEHMTGPLLLVAGDKDITPNINDAWEYHADPYFKTPPSPNTPVKCLAVLDGASHYLGGILGTNRTEERNPIPKAVSAIQEISLAFFKQSLRGPTSGLLADYLDTKPDAFSRFECK
jgi:predicted dienelactone hydrolase